MVMPLEERVHALYRFYGAGGTLLYIGLTADLTGRLGKHKDEKPWWTGIAKITVEHYPDRATVVEAERRAIIAEKPLYNQQHNRRPPATHRSAVVERPHRPGMPVHLKAICMGCRRDFQGDSAVIHVPVEQAYRRLEAIEERERECANKLTFLKISDLRVFEERYPEAKWGVHCDRCNPHKDKDGTMCGGCYAIEVGRCRTWPQLLNWTAHLSEKNWLRATNWPDFIRAVSTGDMKTGLVPVNMADTIGADA